MNNLFSLEGKISLVTGSSRGIGFTLARGLGRAGSTIILNGLDKERLDASAKELKNEGIKTYTSQFDVTKKDDVAKEISRIEKEIGSIEILVNNAGIQRRFRLEDFAESDWDAIMDINLKGVFLTSQQVAKGMLSRRSGKIINICSLQSELGRESIAPYAASKGGVKMLTRGMATDWAKYNIQVNGIGPGYFITEMTKPLADNPEFDSWLRKRTPADRWGDPEELVGTAVYLASEASSFINGQIIYVDGGVLASI